MSDIEETMSILSRRSRSTTPTQFLRHQNNNQNNFIVNDRSDYGSLDRRLQGIKGKKLLLMPKSPAHHLLNMSLKKTW